MTKAKKPPKLHAFDAARYLGSDEAIAEYMTAVLEAEDPELLLLALGDVARAKGMGANQDTHLSSNDTGHPPDPPT